MANAPTVTSGSKTTFDDTSNQKLDIADAIDAMDPRDTPMLALLGKDSLRSPCIAKKHEWLEDELIPSAAEVDAAYSSGGLVFNPRPVGGASGDDASPFFNVDDVVFVNDKHYQVTEVTGNLVYVRLLSSADAAHSVGDKMYILGNAQTEGSVARVVSEFTDLTRPFNYTQIFKDEVTVTGTAEAIAKYGYSSELSYQLTKKLQEMAIQFERAVIYGIRNLASSNVQPAYMMGGLYYFIRTKAGGTVDSNIIKNGGSSALTQSVLDGVLESLWALGGTPSHILVNGFQKRTISSWMSPYVQTGMDYGRLGTIVSEYRSDFGTLPVVLNRYLKQSDLIIIDKDKIGIGPLTGRAFATEPIAKRGDSVERMIIGEYTMECRVYDRAHGWIYDLATS